MFLICTFLMSAVSSSVMLTTRFRLLISTELAPSTSIDVMDASMTG